MTSAPSNSPTQRQISGFNAAQEFVLAGIVKRTYELSERGPLVLADEQVPIVEAPLFDEQVAGLMLDDSDLYSGKLYSDVIVEGHAYSERPSTGFIASIAVGSALKRLLVQGPRRCELTSAGICFGAAEPISKVALSYKHAYGGRDLVAEQKRGNPLAELAKYCTQLDMRLASPFVYPRNPAGVDFLMDLDAEAVAALELPQLEDPDDQLTPERLACGEPERWQVKR